MRIGCITIAMALALAVLPVALAIARQKIEAASQPVPVDHPALAIGTPVAAIRLESKAFVVGYDPRFRVATWCAECLTKESVSANVERVGWFRQDGRLHGDSRATAEDYEGSGYDRGHLACAANMPDAEAMNESFRLTNVVPQNPDLNRGLWADLEREVRDVASAGGVRVYVFTGPLFAPPVVPSGRSTDGTATIHWIGPGHVAVPTHLYKAVYELRRKNGLDVYHATGWVIPNRKPAADARLSNFVVPIRLIEHWAGVDFAANLPDEIEERLEK